MRTRQKLTREMDIERLIALKNKNKQTNVLSSKPQGEK